MCFCIVLALFYCYVFMSPSICFQGTKHEINHEDVVYLHCRRFYNDMALVPKFRNDKRCWRKLEKQNTWLKPEMIGYLCFSSRRILWLWRYSLAFGFPYTCSSVHSPWYQWQNCSCNMTRIQALFWLGNRSNRQGLLRCASHFLFHAHFLWRSGIYKLAMKWYPMCVCIRWLCPFKVSRPSFFVDGSLKLVVKVFLN